MGNSLMIGCAKMGMNFTGCCPEKYQPDAALVAQCQAIAAETGATIRFTADPAEGTKGANVIYTDVWVSMGEPDGGLGGAYPRCWLPYQVNKAAMDNGVETAVFMHCLPAFHDHKTTVGKEMGERFGLRRDGGHRRGVRVRALHRL